MTFGDDHGFFPSADIDPSFSFSPSSASSVRPNLRETTILERENDCTYDHRLTFTKCNIQHPHKAAKCWLGFAAVIHGAKKKQMRKMQRGCHPNVSKGASVGGVEMHANLSVFVLDSSRCFGRENSMKSRNK